ncbi:MAG: 1-(5-phosphoribosyl)-5-[(5-phosphoribosylamino)methylideneamino]imidazole-4-carboxamide isomerase [Candidatus Omnitrophota bacterium]
MNIIPAIDIMYNRVVRLQRGKFDKERMYSENPILVAKGWDAYKPSLLHIVDLDGARLGKPVNKDLVEEIVKSVKAGVELGGGLRTEQDIDGAFAVGVRSVVIGTSAVGDDNFCKLIIEKYKEKLIFAVDVKDEKVAVKGWKEVSQLEVDTYIKRLEGLGAKRIIYTDISRDGMMVGPNLDKLRSILQLSSMDVTASGGVSNIEDIKALKKMETDGLKSVIVGKALYEGTLNLEEAMRVS